MVKVASYERELGVWGLSRWRNAQSPQSGFLNWWWGVAPRQIKGIKAVLIPERQRLTVTAAAGGKPTILAPGKTLAELRVEVQTSHHIATPRPCH